MKLRYPLLGISLALLSISRAADLYWKIDGTTGTLTSANWSATGSAPYTTAWTAGSNVIFSAASLMTYVTNTNVGNITANDDTTVTQAGTLNTGGNVRTITVASGKTLTWTTQTVSTTAGTGFIKDGAGTLNMGAWAGAYTGGFTLINGTVIVSGNQAFGTGALTINGGTIQSSGTRAFQSSSLAIGGDFALAGTGNANWTANMALGSATRQITNSTTSGSRQFLGVISGDNSGVGLTFAGTGAAQVYVGNVANSYGGPLAVNGGEVVFNGNAALGNTTAITVDGGRFTLASMDTSGNTAAITTTVDSSRNIYVGNTAGTALSVASAGTATYNGVIADKTGVTGSWSKQGSGTLILGGANVYSGDTTIGNGTLRLASGSNRLPTGTVVNIGQAASTNVGTLDLNGQSQQVAGLNSITGTNVSVATNTVTSTVATTLTLGGGGSYSYGSSSTTNSGVISGAISVVKTGLGTQVLGGANTYIGPTTVSVGTLLITGSLGNTATDVQSGGTLGGSGTIGGTVTVENGGTVSVGANTDAGTIGTFGMGGLVLAGALQIGATGDTAFDKINLGAGTFTASGGVIQFTTAGGYVVPVNTSFDVADFAGNVTGSLTFDFSGAAVQPGGSWDTSAFASTGMFSYVIPEPNAALLGLLGCAGLLRRRR